jgi:hypothetical protein
LSIELNFATTFAIIANANHYRDCAFEKRIAEARFFSAKLIRTSKRKISCQKLQPVNTRIFHGIHISIPSHGVVARTGDVRNQGARHS